MKYKPYSICTPEFEPLSGGIRVMYGLYGHLLARGHIVYLNAKYEDPNFIAVYPEIYHGNQSGANTVVRYVLNKPGVMATNGIAGPRLFGPNDKVYVFSKLYDTFGVDDDHLMFLPIINTHLFKDQGKKRPNKCVFVGKGTDLDIPETKGLTRITRELSMDQGALADYLNTCQVMYSFENPTAMNEIARLCGCRVVFIPEGATIKYTEEELEKYEPSNKGIAWGVGKDKEFDVKAFREHYMSLKEMFEAKLDKFINDTQND